MKKYLVALLIIMVLMLQTACNMQITDDKLESESGEIMGEFNSIIASEEMGFNDVVEFMQANIETLTSEDSSEMVLGFEKYHREYRAIIEESFYIEKIQELFQEVYKEGAVDLNQPEQIDDNLIKSLVEESIRCGYKVEQAEGQFFPIIDYSFYQDLGLFTTSDIKEYLKIMKTESDQASLKDAELLISWEEAIRRALKLEEFLSTHNDSQKSEEVRELYEKYMEITFFGSPNSPAFDPKTDVLKKEVKVAYEEAISTDIDSDFIRELQGFMELLSDSNYELTEEVKQYSDVHYRTDL